MEADPVWIRGPHLRKRWGDPGKPMPNSTFHDRRKKGLIPPPEFPFGPDTPYWRLAVIEAVEARAAAQAELRVAAAVAEKPHPSPMANAAPPNEPAPKRKPGRPRKATTAPGPGQDTTARRKAQAQPSEVAP